MTKRLAMVAIALLVLAGIGCGGSAHYAEESTADDGATGSDSGGDSGADTGGARATTTTTSAGGEAPPPSEPRMPGEPEPMVAASEEWNAMLEADQDLNASLELAQPDCDAAGQYIERLCDLAERICEIAEDTGDAGAGDRCTDGTARCERGRSAYADACD